MSERKIIKKFEEVKKLEETTDPEAQVSLLQKIAARLLNECVIRVGSVTIEPLLVEAYYYDPKNGFIDENTHRSEYQKNRFGKLYFHRMGRGGVDLCLSDGDYYLSYLIKNALVTANGTCKFCSKFCSKFCRQTYLEKELNNNGLKGTDEYALYEREHKENRIVVYTVRKGLTKCESYRNMPIAAVTGFELTDEKGKRYSFDLEKGHPKESLVVEYIRNHPKEFSEAQFKDLFMDYIPREIRERGWLK